MKKRVFKEYLTGYMFIAPLLIGLFIFRVIGFFQNISYSFTEAGAFGPAKFIGLENYKRLFSDTQMWYAVRNTFRFVLFNVPGIVFFSLIAALLLNSKIKKIGFFRTLFFLPAVTLPVAIMMIWSWMLNTDYGVFNAIITYFGGEKVSWLGSKTTLTASFFMVTVWSSVSIPSLILLAGLNDISKTYYDASKIDGANKIQVFFNVTLPLLTPSLFYVVVTTMIAMFKLFDIVYLMIPQEGSPSMRNAMTMAYYYYTNAFVYVGERGYASAISVVLLVLIVAFTGLMFILQKKWVYYDN